MKQPKSMYVCTECGYTSPKWLGRCSECGAWNTFEEHAVRQVPSKTASSSRAISTVSGEKQTALPLSQLQLTEYIRRTTGLGELDRVLGGGLVSGSVVLLAGEPGVGKSTLLTQVCANLSERSDGRIMYVSGEESLLQMKLRAERLGVSGDGLLLLNETSLDIIMSELDRIKPDVTIIDSIQTIYNPEINSAPGSITQVREAAFNIISRAKTDGVSVIIVGHVNKEGGIAGPKVLEHMVDAVLYFEGERRYAYRIIRAVKNRFGSTDEIGVFEMDERGLTEVPNPSEMLLADRPKGVSGNCAVCIIEGTRPIIAEVQALVTPTVFPSGKRTANGIDYNRAYLLLAVLEKRLGLRYSTSDVYLNVIGGLHIDEPTADLALCLALISSYKDIPVPDGLIAFGEVGLSGECRTVSCIEQRLREASRLGFTCAVIPKRTAEKLTASGDIPAGMEIISARSVFDLANLF